MRSRLYGLALTLLVSGCCAKTHPPSVAPQGIIWVDPHDMVVADWERITLSTNGTDVFIDTKPIVTTFPEADLVPIYVPTLSPGLNVTGIRVCYGIVGHDANTKVERLRLAQFDPTSGGGTHWPGYAVMLEDLSAGSAAPTPPSGGFAFDDPAGFVCVDSEPSVCLDPDRGTISAAIGTQFGATDDRLVVTAVGLHYDASCTPP